MRRICNAFACRRVRGDPHRQIMGGRSFAWLPARPDPRLSDDRLHGVYRSEGYLPWSVSQNTVWVVITAGHVPSERLRAQWRGKSVRLYPLSRRKFDQALAVRFGVQFVRAASLQLARCAPVLSARVTVTARQRQFLGGGLALLLLCGLLWPQILLHGVVLGSAAGFCTGMCLRFILGLNGILSRRRDVRACLLPRDDTALPVYTVLVPLYDEAVVVPTLVCHLAALDYPRSKLDIKLIVEADDGATRRAADRYSHRYGYSVVVVPPGGPRTKPRACNYALHFARGAYVVVFDAEDHPQTDQLRIAVAAFEAAPPQLACLQGRLTIDNAGECLLSTLFAIDYDIWFSFMLPGLERLRAPIPLGGTSNHFRTDVLRRIGGWDPYNVTEDADLGMRLATRGYDVGMLDAQTAEEAPVHLNVWMRQRTRWLKGYMQTFLVYLRSPVALFHRLGPTRMLLFLALLGGTNFSALLNPFLWIIFVSAELRAIPVASHDMSRLLALWSGGGLCLANSFLISLVFWSERWRGNPRRIFYGISMVGYWMLISVAAWRGLCQLLYKPHLWEKTPHGSRQRCAS